MVSLLAPLMTPLMMTSLMASLLAPLVASLMTLLALPLAGIISEAYTGTLFAFVGWIGLLAGTIFTLNYMPNAPGRSAAYPKGDKPMFGEQMSDSNAMDPLPNGIIFNWATIFVLGFGNLCALDFQARATTECTLSACSVHAECMLSACSVHAECMLTSARSSSLEFPTGPRHVLPHISRRPDWVFRRRHHHVGRWRHLLLQLRRRARALWALIAVCRVRGRLVLQGDHDHRLLRRGRDWLL
jgi:hypothetical protein